MSGTINDYICQLDGQLRQRGIFDPRTLAEAREHLVDAVDEARQRGLSLEDAEREALERFGAAEIVAARVLEEREHMTLGFAGALGTVWLRKWWILVPTVLAAVVTGVTSYYVQPVRYRAVATILVVPQQVREDYVRSSVTTTIEKRLRSIDQQVRSRARLERIIEEFNLYPERRKKDIMQDIVEDMSKAIDVDIIQSDVFRVAFTSDNPRTAQRVAEKLSSFFIDESLRDRAQLAQQTSDFLEQSIAELRRKIVASEAKLKDLRGHSEGEPLSQADVIPYETLKETYKALLVKSVDAQIAANLEQRQIGEQFRIIDQARVPETPVGPNRLRVIVLGSLIGLFVGFGLVVVRSSSNTRPPALAQA